MKTLVVFFLCQIFCLHFLYAQEVTNQFWLEYRPTYVFTPKVKLDMRLSFRDEFDDTNWHTWEARFIPVIKLGKGFDANLGLSFLETSQSLVLSTTEVRLAPGVRYKLPWKRVELGAWLRLEFRWVHDKQQSAWNYTTRPRLRFFTDIPINAKSMEGDHFFYASSFVEFFYQDDSDVQERYAQKLWMRVGLGYKLNKSLRFEVLYTRQDSKNTIQTSFEDLTNENIFVLALRHKLKTKQKKVPATK